MGEMMKKLKQDLRERTETVISNNRYDHNAFITEAKKQTGTNYGTTTSHTNIARRMWVAHPRTADLRWWTCYIFSVLKYVLSTMGVSKESIRKFLIGNRFHVKLRILSPYSNRFFSVFSLVQPVF